MPYDIILAPEAVDDLVQLKAHMRSTVRDALASYLRHQPMQVSKSRIKRLRGLRHPQYRLRIDDIRVFYDVQEQAVEVLAIIDKSEAAAWLAQFGEPEQGVTDEADPAVGSEE